jgi:hypothetical protein
MPNPGAAPVTVATQYSSVAGGNNAYPNLQNVSMVSGYPKLLCLETPPLNIGSGCAFNSSGQWSCPSNPCSGLPALANAIRVRQQVSVPLHFAALFGTKSLPVMATSTAIMRGVYTPYNVAIVVDSTDSMNTQDTNSQCSSYPSRIACALAGVQVLLDTLSPCPAGATSCSLSQGVDTVSLFTFPAVNSSDVSLDYTTPCQAPSQSMIEPYAYNTTSPLLPLSPGAYQIVGFLNNYRTSDMASYLNTGTELVGAAGTSTSTTPPTGTGNKNGCLAAVGGQGTYYAQVIYSATEALLAQPQTGRQNALIILSDGDATSTCRGYNATTGICTSGPMTGACTGFGTNPTTTDCNGAQYSGAPTGLGTYESTFYQCKQAVTAAQYAQNKSLHNPITVYSVAYGAESSGCASDNTPCGGISSPTNPLQNCVPATKTPNALTPCTTMEAMASSPSTFFSDYSQSGTGINTNCISAANPTDSLNGIFQAIAGDLTVARLVPDSAK